MKKKLNSEDLENLAREIITFLTKNGIYQDIIIYINNKRYLSNNYNNNLEEYRDNNIHYYIERNINVKDYIEYSNPELLTMSFEGDFYDIINDYISIPSIVNSFNNIINKYELYYEFGDTWNLSTYYN